MHRRVKTCRKCGQDKPVGEFSDSKRGVDGRNPNCKQCVRAYANAAYARNKKHLFDTGEVSSVCKHCGDPFTYTKTTGMRRWYCSARCKFEVADGYRLARAKQARKCTCGSVDVTRVGTAVCADCRKDKRDKEKRREYQRGRKLAMYGLTQADFDALLDRQQNACAICTTAEPGTKGWHIDHDHACCPGVGSCGNCVRGLLCGKCNLLLGHADDSTVRLDQAKAYLVARAQFQLRAV